MSSFLYPRTLTITRVSPLTAGGNQGRRDASQSGEVAVLSGVPANIYDLKRAPKPPTDLPADAVWQEMCKILIPGSAAAPGAIQRNDIATDDQGQRYRIMTPNLKSGLGTQMQAWVQSA